MIPENYATDVPDAESARLRLMGDPIRVFGPSMANAVAGLILGALMIGGGGLAIFVAVRGVIEAGGNLPFLGASRLVLVRSYIIASARGRAHCREPAGVFDRTSHSRPPPVRLSKWPLLL